MKNLISTLFLGGALAIGGCGEFKKNKFLNEINTELTEFNKENQKIYQDAAYFVREKGKWNDDYKSHDFLSQDSSEKIALRISDNDLELCIESSYGHTKFIDYNLDGLDSKNRLMFTSDNKNFFYFENYSRKAANFHFDFEIGEFVNGEFGGGSPLAYAEEYTDKLKQIMHETKYKKY